MYYRIYRVKLGKVLYFAEYKRSVNGRWKAYTEGDRTSWEEAYKVLEQHANPAILAVRFVGTF